MLHKTETNTSNYDLNGYLPYQFVEEFGGTWTPFNHSSSKHVGTLNLAKFIQKHLSQEVSPHNATCQGSAFSYLQHGASMQGLSNQKINVKALANVANLQISYGSVEEGRKVMEEMEFIPIRRDAIPSKMDLDNILSRIKHAEGNVFILTGNCSGENQSVPYEAAHCFTIVNDGKKWKLFEAQRGEVVFDSFELFSQWLMKEATEGALRDLTSPRAVEVRRDDNFVSTRYYDTYSLDVYKKDFSANSQNRVPTGSALVVQQAKKENRTSTSQLANPMSHLQLLPVSPKKKGPSFFSNRVLPEPTNVNQKGSIEEFVKFIDTKLAGKTENSPSLLDVLIELAVIEAKSNARFAAFTEKDYLNFKSLSKPMGPKPKFD